MEDIEYLNNVLKEKRPILEHQSFRLTSSLVWFIYSVMYATGRSLSILAYYLRLQNYVTCFELFCTLSVVFSISFDLQLQLIQLIALLLASLSQIDNKDIKGY